MRVPIVTRSQKKPMIEISSVPIHELNRLFATNVPARVADVSLQLVRCFCGCHGAHVSFRLCSLKRCCYSPLVCWYYWSERVHTDCLGLRHRAATK